MEPWISCGSGRASKWKGHRSVRAVRQAIAYDKGRDALRLFELADGGLGAAMYMEVPRDEWDERFAK